MPLGIEDAFPLEDAAPPTPDTAASTTEMKQMACRVIRAPLGSSLSHQVGWIWSSDPLPSATHRSPTATATPNVLNLGPSLSCETIASLSRSACARKLVSSVVNQT